MTALDGLSLGFSTTPLVITSIPELPLMAPADGEEPLNEHVEAYRFTKIVHETVYDSVSPLNPNNSAVGKVVVVTGGGKGIGKAVASAFALSGATGVVLLGRDKAALEASREEIQSPGVKVLCYAADITVPDQVRAVFKAALDIFGHIDVLINNAGYLSAAKDFDQISIEDYWESFEVNVKGGIVVTLEYVKTAQPGSTIVNMSSAAAHVSFYQGYSSYSSSKLAFWRIMEFVQHECPQMRTFNLNPGTCLTDMTRKSGFPTQTDLGK